MGPAVPSSHGFRVVEVQVGSLVSEQREEGWDKNSCQARCEAGGYACKNMKHCAPPQWARHYTEPFIFRTYAFDFYLVSVQESTPPPTHTHTPSQLISMKIAQS